MIRYFLNKIKKKQKEEYGWFGRYASWEEASAVSDGYGKDIILEKTKESLLKIKSGEAVYERDSVIFDKKEYPFPLITFLQHSAFQKDAPLNVLDFGGSLGSNYFQVKEFLNERVCTSWNVVEQPHYVSYGKEFFEDGQLHFFHSIEDCIAKHHLDLIVLSGVVQYLRDPHVFLEKLVSFNFKYIIFDRTAFIHEDTDRLTVQRVWPSVYNASYPSWFFNEETFLSHFLNNYEVKADFRSYIQGEEVIYIDGKATGVDKGFYLQSKQSELA